jgi:hypothetical protein
MNEQQTYERMAHRHTESGVITRVEDDDKMFTISANGWGFGIQKPIDEIPKVGQTVTIYLFHGSCIQGVDLDGKPLFFKSKADLKVERQAALRRMEVENVERKVKFFAELDNPQSEFNRRLNSLPKVFQQRFKRFFRLGEDFWDLAWYELSRRLNSDWGLSSSAKNLTFLSTFSTSIRLSAACLSTLRSAFDLKKRGLPSRSTPWIQDPWKR